MGLLGLLGLGFKAEGTGACGPVVHCSEVRVTSVTGHLMEMEFEGPYRQWKGCEPIDLFDAPIKKYVPDKNAGIAETLKQEVQPREGIGGRKRKGRKEG